MLELVDKLVWKQELVAKVELEELVVMVELVEMLELVAKMELQELVAMVELVEMLELVAMLAGPVYIVELVETVVVMAW